ncbi:MAG: TIGR03905 family TSCPD domain-containing protein [Lentisphaeria bacterium]
MKSYPTSGVCCAEIAVKVEDGILKNVEFSSGCPGNLIGIKKLTQNRKVSEIIELLKGTTCGMKSTSCPDQLAQILEKHK